MNSCTASVGLQVLVGSGLADRTRAELGLRVALSAASCGTSVIVFLAQDGGVWGCRRGADSDATEVFDLVDKLIEVGVKLECCAVCAEKLCQTQDARHAGLRDEVEPVGLVTLSNRASAGVPTMTF